jgi:hypothetical protein
MIKDVIEKKSKKNTSTSKWIEIKKKNQNYGSNDEIKNKLKFDKKMKNKN